MLLEVIGTSSQPVLCGVDNKPSDCFLVVIILCCCVVIPKCAVKQFSNQAGYFSCTSTPMHRSDNHKLVVMLQPDFKPLTGL